MYSVLNQFKPAVPKKILLFFAGIMWCCVGIMLMSFAYRWLSAYQGKSWIFGTTGFAAALIIHHFGFLKVANKNLNRISGLPEKPCFFSFISWKSYLLILVMVSMGIALRHSSLPKQFLSILYLGIGLALFLSSVRYFRMVFK